MFLLHWYTKGFLHLSDHLWRRDPTLIYLSRWARLRTSSVQLFTFLFLVITKFFSAAFGWQTHNLSCFKAPRISNNRNTCAVVITPKLVAHVNMCFSPGWLKPAAKMLIVCLLQVTPHKLMTYYVRWTGMTEYLPWHFKTMKPCPTPVSPLVGLGQLCRFSTHWNSRIVKIPSNQNLFKAL